MIKIDKSPNIPQILLNKGAIETSKLEQQFNTNSNFYKSRPGVKVKQIRKFVFDKSIYGNTTVKTQLMADQHHKCCYCEAKFRDNGFGDVEHFRPKGAYVKNGMKKLTYPGYYWLAYDWNNLLFSCQRCNEEFKKNHFPLDVELTRKEYHNHPNTITLEDRLLINPILEDPSRYFEFKDEVPVPKNNNKKGNKTIEIYGLERLNDTRLEHLQIIKGLLVTINIDETDDDIIRDEATARGLDPDDLRETIVFNKRFCNSAAKDTAKFAYCVRCKFPQLPII